MLYSKSDFNYDLPEELIARYPLEKRSASRLLIAEENAFTDRQVVDFIEYLTPKDLLVFNNTKVIPARLFGQKASGGKVEIMVERIQSTHLAKVYLRASKAPTVGSEILLKDFKATVIERDEGIFYLESDTAWTEILNTLGSLPIPPYFSRQAESLDSERYQTVYAKHAGAVAAPTAGLHFDSELLNTLKSKVAIAEVTLHVGAGTFQPVRHEDLSQHIMHKELYFIDKETISSITDCKKRGGRVIAVGTTSLRALESWAKTQSLTGDTDLFITPPYQFKVVDALFTNFHLPESTLLMLVSAFLGYERTKAAYQHAIDAQYRFYSYGDAMFIPKIC